MSTIAYICFVVIASLFGTVIGVVAHYARAHFTYLPEDLSLGEPWNTLTREDYAFEKHVVGAEWDDNGFWDADSNRNLAYYALSGFAMPFIFGFLFWAERQDIVKVLCRGIKATGLSPLICV